MFTMAKSKNDKVKNILSTCNETGTQHESLSACLSYRSVILMEKLKTEADCTEHYVYFRASRSSLQQSEHLFWMGNSSRLFQT